MTLRHAHSRNATPVRRNAGERLSNTGWDIARSVDRLRPGQSAVTGESGSEVEADTVARAVSRATSARSGSEGRSSRTDFSQVRVHTDESAGRAAHQLNARAFTLGNNIFFHSAHSDTKSASGRALLAHELTHVVQFQEGRHSSAVPCRKGLTEAFAEAGEWYEKKKWAVYRKIIAGLRAGKNSLVARLRSKVPSLPAWAHGSANTIIDLLDFVIDMLNALCLAIIGLAVGFVEGIAGLITGLVKIAWGLIKFVSDILLAVFGRPEELKEDLDFLAAAIRNFRPAIEKMIGDWIARYKAATLEEQVLMGAELVGQLEALIASFYVAGARGAQAGNLSIPAVKIVQGGEITLSATGEAALKAAPQIVATTVTVPVKPLAQAGVLAVQATSLATAGGGGGGGGGSKKGFDKPLTEKEVDKALEPIDPKKKPELKGEAGGKSRRAAAAGAVQLSVEDVVLDAMRLLKRRGLSGGLGPSEYGTRLHAALNEVIQAKVGTVPKGWDVLANRRLAEVLNIRPQYARMTVSEYVKEWGLTEQYSKLPSKFMGTELGEIRPDIVVKAPNGQKLVWDLTSELNEAHLSKTLFYSEVVGREEGGFIKVGEAYWREFSLK